MAIFRQNWILQHETFFDTWVDIDFNVSGTIDTDTIRGMSLVAGAINFGEYIATPEENNCFLGIVEECETTLPPDADPPFPPVYPYFFSTYLL